MATGTMIPVTLKKDKDILYFDSIRSAWLAKLCTEKDPKDKIGSSNRKKVERAIENETQINGYYIYYTSPPSSKKAFSIGKNSSSKKPHSSSDKDTPDSTPSTASKNSLPEAYEIANLAEKFYDQINANYRLNGRNPIFENVPEILELWRNIRTTCESESGDDFCKFISSLYMLFFETTKDKDPYGSLDNKGYPKHIKRLPEEFTKPNTDTYKFMDIVGILRHNLGYAHIGSKMNIPPWKISYPDALKKLLGYIRKPNSKEQYQKLQIEVLKLFSSAMKDLDKLVEKKLIPPTNP